LARQVDEGVKQAIEAEEMRVIEGEEAVEPSIEEGYWQLKQAMEK